MSVVADETIKELIKSIERLTEAVLQMDLSGGATTQAKRIAGETTTASKEVASSSSSTAAGGGLSGYLGAAMSTMSSAASAAKTAYELSPLKQTAMPSLYDIHMQKYTKPREQILQIAEDYAQSGRALTQNEVQSIMKGINQQVTALQSSEKLLAGESSLTPNIQRVQERVFDVGSKVVEGGFKAVDAWVGSGMKTNLKTEMAKEAVTATQEYIAPAVINQLLSWLLERGSVK